MSKRNEQCPFQDKIRGIGTDEARHAHFCNASREFLSWYRARPDEIRHELWMLYVWACHENEEWTFMDFGDYALMVYQVTELLSAIIELYEEIPEASAARFILGASPSPAKGVGFLFFFKMKNLKSPTLYIDPYLPLRNVFTSRAIQ